MDSYRSPKVEVHDSTIHGRGAFAIAPILLGEIVAVRSGSVNSYAVARLKDAHLGGFSMQVEPGLFLCPDVDSDLETLPAYLNHSCDPNVGVRGQITFVAMRSIAIGEELTTDYGMNIAYPYSLECHCATSLCRRRVTGEDWSLPSLQARYSGFWDGVTRELILGTIDEVWLRTRCLPIPYGRRALGILGEIVPRALSGFEPFETWRLGWTSRADYIEALPSLLQIPSTLPLARAERLISARLHLRPEGFLRAFSDLLTTWTKGPTASSKIWTGIFETIARRWHVENVDATVFPEEVSIVAIVGALVNPETVLAINQTHAIEVGALSVASPNLVNCVLMGSSPDVAARLETNLLRISRPDCAVSRLSVPHNAQLHVDVLLWNLDTVDDKLNIPTSDSHLSSALRLAPDASCVVFSHSDAGRRRDPDQTIMPLLVENSGTSWLQIVLPTTDGMEVFLRESERPARAHG